MLSFVFFLYLLPNWFFYSCSGIRRLKGNQVKILDRPAAVKLYITASTQTFATG